MILKIGDVELSFGSKKKTNNELKQDIIIFIDKVKKYKSERNNFAKLPDVPETPHSNDNFAVIRRLLQNLMRVITGFHFPSYCEPQLPSSLGNFRREPG